MIDPISNINTSCKSCHPTDAAAKAQVYAVTLGKQVGLGASTSSSSQAAPTAAPAAGQSTSAPTQSAPAAAPAAAIPAVDMVDYSQRYDAVALGKQPVNIGNIILVTLLAVFVLGGGLVVLRREGWINISFDNPKRVAVQEKYPPDVVRMLPDLSRLKRASRKNLQNILAKPQAAGDLFASIDRLTQQDVASSETETGEKDPDASLSNSKEE